MKHTLKIMKVSYLASTVQNSVKNIDQNVQFDLFETGVFEEEPEPTQSTIHPILEHHHEASTSTPPTSNAATVDNTRPPDEAPDEAETDVEEFV